RADEAVDHAGGLHPDLRPGRNIVGLAVVEIVPLVGEQDAVALARAQLVGEPAPDMLIVIWVGIGHRRHFDQLGATEPQHVLLLLALGLRDDDDGAVSERVGNERKPDPGVAGGASTTSPPGRSSPRFSASRIIWRAGRSLTEPPGFMNSALPRMVQPVASETRRSLIKGVLPIASMTSS